MPLSPGDKLGPYEIVPPLGAGGMGEVYRARDSKLNREVAIKVLPSALSDDAQYMARFEREAQMLAAQNHPNIATVYGIEQGALVMELVEGADLKGPLPVDEAIAIARQIAAGLEAAHEKGIIHRDLKPANIKLTPAGVVKILDFGLAKSADTNSAASGSNPTISPTLSLAMTQAGMILGTAAYMSPEQARGKPVDKRADIWAFGVVLFEMLTGKMLFGGQTVSDSLAAVLTREPGFNALSKDTPPRVRRLLEHCLRKDPKLRLQAIGDARILLDESEPEAPASVRRWIPWSVAGMLALAVLGAAGAWLGPMLRPKAADPGPGSVRFFLPLPPGTRGSLTAAAAQAVPSPDGRYLAFIALDSSSGKESVWVRPLGATSAHRLDKTEGAGFPFWSPDSQSIGFFADEKLKRVAVSGGSVQTICDVSKSATRGAGGEGGTWSQEGVIVFGGHRGTPLMRVPAVGGVPTAVTALEKDELWHGWPQFLPDGRHLMYFAVNK